MNTPRQTVLSSPLLKPNRRSFLAGAGALLGGAALAGCSGGSPSGTSTSGTWRFTTIEGAEEMVKWNEHFSTFFSDQPDITPSVDFGVPWDQYWTKLQISIAGANPPDMCWMHDTRVGLYATQGLVQPLGDFIADAAPQGWPSEFYASQVSSFQVDGQQYGIPYDFASCGIYVNLDMLDAAGVTLPAEGYTYDDLLEMGRRLTDDSSGGAKQWGFSFPLGGFLAYPTIRAFGGDYTSGEFPDLEPRFTDAGTAAGFQWLFDAIHVHGVMPNEADISSSIGQNADPTAFFASGRVGMFVGFNDTAFVMEDLIGDTFRWTVIPMPTGPAGRFQVTGGSAFSIPRDAPMAQVSYDLMSWMLSDPAVATRTAQMGSMFVSKASLWESGVPAADVLDQDAYRRVFYELAKEEGVHPLYYPSYGKWDTTVYTRHFDVLWNGETDDVEGVLATVQDETAAIINT